LLVAVAVATAILFLVQKTIDTNPSFAGDTDFVMASWVVEMQHHCRMVLKEEGLPYLPLLTVVHTDF
jgi:hypothetical protein